MCRKRKSLNALNIENLTLLNSRTVVHKYFFFCPMIRQNYRKMVFEGFESTDFANSLFFTLDFYPSEFRTHFVKNR